MELPLLRSLLAVAEQGSVSDAARTLGLTQPALSRRLQQLEEEMGALLLERSRKGTVLTDAGRLVVEEARRLVEGYESLKQKVQARESLQSGLVRLGGGATAVSFLVPEAIARFSRLYPELRFQVKEQGSREVEADVSAERLELGIVTLPVHSKEFEVSALHKDRIVLVAGAGHPLARKKRIEAAELQGQGLVAFEAGSAIRKLIDQALREAGVEMNVQMELRSIAAILEMVSRTGALAFVSRLGVERPDPGIAVLEVQGLSIHRRLAVISKRGRPLSAAAKAFAGMLG